MLESVHRLGSSSAADHADWHNTSPSCVVDCTSHEMSLQEQHACAVAALGTRPRWAGAMAAAEWDRRREEVECNPECGVPIARLQHIRSHALNISKDLSSLYEHLCWVASGRRVCGGHTLTMLHV